MDFEALANLQWKCVCFFSIYFGGLKWIEDTVDTLFVFSKALNLASKLDLPSWSWDPLEILGNLPKPRLGGFHLTPSKTARAFFNTRSGS
jgi:hypothetical protein